MHHHERCNVRHAPHHRVIHVAFFNSDTHRRYLGDVYSRQQTGNSSYMMTEVAGGASSSQAAPHVVSGAQQGPLAYLGLGGQSNDARISHRRR
jgi:hypothetical protein